MRFLYGAPGVCALVVALGSFDNKTRWEGPGANGRPGPYGVSTWESWAGPALMWALVTLVLAVLLVRQVDPGRANPLTPRARLLMLGTIVFGFAVTLDLAWGFLDRTRAQPLPAGESVHIANGLALVIPAAFAGFALSLLLTIGWAFSELGAAWQRHHHNDDHARSASIPIDLQQG